MNRMIFASLPIEELSNAFSNSSIFTMICLLTIVFALTYSVIQSSFFSQQSQAMFTYNSICIPAPIEELLLLTYSVTQRLVNLTKIRCSCKTSCSTARCACRKAVVICNLNCHPHNRQCSNVN
jgi:hypothetical protein